MDFLFGFLQHNPALFMHHMQQAFSNASGPRGGGQDDPTLGPNESRHPLGGVCRHLKDGSVLQFHTREILANCGTGAPRQLDAFKASFKEHDPRTYEWSLHFLLQGLNFGMRQFDAITQRVRQGDSREDLEDPLEHFVILLLPDVVGEEQEMEAEEAQNTKTLSSMSESKSSNSASTSKASKKKLTQKERKNRKKTKTASETENDSRGEDGRCKKSPNSTGGQNGNKQSRPRVRLLSLRIRSDGSDWEAEAAEIIHQEVKKHNAVAALSIRESCSVGEFFFPVEEMKKRSQTEPFARQMYQLHLHALKMAAATGAPPADLRNLFVQYNGKPQRKEQTADMLLYDFFSPALGMSKGAPLRLMQPILGGSESVGRKLADVMHRRGSVAPDAPKCLVDAKLSELFLGGGGNEKPQNVGPKYFETPAWKVHVEAAEQSQSALFAWVTQEEKKIGGVGEDAAMASLCETIGKILNLVGAAAVAERDGEEDAATEVE
eukprot:CAMPEP_0178985818 /NCGR_PEP_ID=MMETSP0795-20121207/2360_1 /TAXON_ID=88552 /ORGANISM="Amoebophrya sp., Strain Ameob2" /LENGTH=490 /DNA_ID=CAMNT_0020676811 /DNA_START=132 /DNA_END=1604 /DNA_ORIENTATION=-